MAIRIIISVSKEDLATHENLGTALSTLSSQTKELPTACLYFPSNGKLKEMIDILDALSVNYRIDTGSVSNTFGIEG
jgi:hypothetical protein